VAEAGTTEHSAASATEAIRAGYHQPGMAAREGSNTAPPGAQAVPAGPPPDEATIVAALRQGDERAFAWLVDQHHATLVRLALRYVPDVATAEEVAQDTWLHVLKGLGRFQFRSSLKTWIASILVNRARTRGRRERRSMPFSRAWAAALAGGEPAVDPERFFGPEDPARADRWASAPKSWGPEERLVAAETQALVQQTIAGLPLAQREVITLRDVEGWSATQVCNALGLSETNQRVLLHRARSKVRAALERYLSEQP
jgi:RNA polymerase sigma-70 factor, ECF subfamily